MKAKSLTEMVQLSMNVTVTKMAVNDAACPTERGPETGMLPCALGRQSVNFESLREQDSATSWASMTEQKLISCRDNTSNHTVKMRTELRLRQKLEFIHSSVLFHIEISMSIMFFNNAPY